MTKETGGSAFPKAALDPWGNTSYAMADAMLQVRKKYD